MDHFQPSIQHWIPSFQATGMQRALQSSASQPVGTEWGLRDGERGAGRCREGSVGQGKALELGWEEREVY